MTHKISIAVGLLISVLVFTGAGITYYTKANAYNQLDQKYSQLASDHAALQIEHQTTVDARDKLTVGFNNLVTDYKVLAGEHQAEVDAYNQLTADVSVLQAKYDAKVVEYEALVAESNNVRANLRDALAKNYSLQQENSRLSIVPIRRDTGVSEADYDDLVARYKASVAQYNQLVDQYNTLLGQAKQLEAAYNQIVQAAASNPSTQNADLIKLLTCGTQAIGTTGIPWAALLCLVTP